MAHADLEAGRLIALSSVSVRLGHPYCAFMPPAKADRADVAGLVDVQSSGARDLWEGRGAALKPDPDGGVQVAGFSGIGDTGAPGPIFCRLPVITWSPSATPLRMAT